MIRVIGKIDIELTHEEARKLYEELGSLPSSEFKNLPVTNEVWMLLQSKFDPEAGD